MTRLMLVLLGCLALVGCTSGGRRRVEAPVPPPPTTAPSPAESSAHPGDPAPTVSAVTSEGVTVIYPVWLNWPVNAAARALMFSEIRETEPEADPRIAAGTRGVPAGVRVTVLDPGPYYAPYSPTGLAAGEWRQGDVQEIFVAWRGSEREPRRLPALAHELRHLLTRDPLAGH